ncbi:MAG: 3-phosphoglycerate dehydrogenase [Spirochaetales bacterium]|nr:3-phosphoglycerate dehydrogenase [Spirochaetales bacterium]
MHKIQTLNKISREGLSRLPEGKYEYGDDVKNPEGIILRSYKMHDMDLPESLLAIARAGAGTNNIPVEKCAEKGIVVFNTPGANANAVKELALMGLLISSRKVFRSMEWVKTIAGKGNEVPKLVESEKSRFAGQEIKGRRLGIIGLGAIGVMVANDAQALGMDVIGFDPFISVEAAWGLSSTVKKAESLEELVSTSDYISVHIPLNDKTKGFLGRDSFESMKEGVRILNFSRGGLVENEALIAALKTGKVERYVTDFPEDELLGVDNVLAIPHLGASTFESEENCAIMAVDELKEFLETGNIRNSVNFPNCTLPMNGNIRVLVTGRNIPKILSSITSFIGENGVNVAGMINNHKGDYAYTIIDVEDEIDDDVISKINTIDGVITTRVIRPGE